MLPPSIAVLSAKLPPGLDLTDAPADDVIEQTAEQLMQEFTTVAALKAVEAELVPLQSTTPIILLLAVKCAISRKLVQELKEPVHISWVVAMYKETNRMKRRSEHDSGEDFIRRKCRQMQWLAKDVNNLTWDYLYVDDGCPNSSGKVAAELITGENIPNAKVAFIDDGIRDACPILHGMKDNKESQKGGAIQYGMWLARKEERQGKLHIIGFTDSDLSADMKQSGVLIDPIVSNGDCSIASRYEKGGVYCSAHRAEPKFGLESRGCANLTFRNFLRRKILPPLAPIFDTQCGFKAFRAEPLDRILPHVKDKKASFDMEFLVVTQLITGKPLESVAVVWAESLAESTFWTTPNSLWENHFKIDNRMIDIQESHLDLFPADQLAIGKPYVDLIRSLTIQTFEVLMKSIPDLIAPEMADNLFEIDFPLAQMKEILDVGALPDEQYLAARDVPQLFDDLVALLLKEKPLQPKMFLKRHLSSN